MSDKDIEQQIQAKGLTAPRVTPQHIDSVLLNVITLRLARLRALGGLTLMPPIRFTQI